MTPNLIPSGEPFLFRGGEVGCLLLHGFTATPHAMRWMGEFLAERGLTVMGVRLHGHGTTLADLRRSRWKDWLSSLEDGWNQLKDITERVYLIGHSTGGTLALLASTQLEVAGVIAIAALMEIPRIPKILKPLLWPMSYLKPYLNKGKGRWHDPSMADQYISYPAYPVRTMIELDRLLTRLNQVIPEIKTPVLLIHSRNDDFIPLAQMHKLDRMLRTEIKECFLLENSTHIVTMDSERELAYQAAYDFIQRLERDRN